MGIPWETIIKECRRGLGNQAFATASGYAEFFFNFLASATFFSQDFEDEFASYRIDGYFQVTKEDVLEQVTKKLDESCKITKKESRSIFEDVVSDHYDDWLKAQPLPQFPGTYEKDFLNQRRKAIDESIKRVFENLPVSQASRAKLRTIAAKLFCCDRFPGGTSGIVIAGYGLDEIFPSLTDCECDCRIDGFVKYKHKKQVHISEKSTSAVVPFAQTEMVSTFMEGIDPRLRVAVVDGLHALLSAYTDLVKTHIAGSDIDDQQFNDHAKVLLDEFFAYISEYRLREHVNPIIDMVALLPKDELALMAEALVNLTSLKRRVTPDAETVGGPIDVAVITKGDGLVWIKRKHYFDQSLNQHFFHPPERS